MLRDACIGMPYVGMGAGCLPAPTRVPSGVPLTIHNSPMPEPTWSPDSWRSKPLEQRITYPDPEALRSVLAELAKLPPLVTSWEVEALKQQLAEASRGERFLLQGGDCSENFDDCQPRSSPATSRCC